MEKDMEQVEKHVERYLSREITKVGKYAGDGFHDSADMEGITV